MDYKQLIDEIRKLNLNKDYTNPNHDKKLVNFFYNLQKSNELDMVEVKKTTDILTNEYGKGMRITIQDIAYFISLLNPENS